MLGSPERAKRRSALAAIAGAVGVAALCVPAAGSAWAGIKVAQADTSAAAPAAGSDSAAPRRERRRQARADRVEARITELHQKLRITAAQEPEFKTFADVMRTNVTGMGNMARQRWEARKTMNAIDDLRSYEDMAQAHADHVRELVRAFQPLYDKLSPEQKKAADVAFNDMGPRRGKARRARSEGAAG